MSDKNEVKATRVEALSFHIVNFFVGFRKVFALIICSALLSASMYFNGYYGWIMASSVAGKYVMAGLYASLDASLAYLSCMVRPMVKEFGDGWKSLYFLCAVLVFCSVFTCVSYFAANSAINDSNKMVSVNDALTSLALTRGNLASESMGDWNAKLKTTHNNTTSWNDQKQVEANRLDQSIKVLSDIRADKASQPHASDAVFRNLGLENNKDFIRSIFGTVLAITTAFMVLVLGRDMFLTKQTIETGRSKVMKPKGKSKIESRTPVKKAGTDARTHAKYGEICKAVSSLKTVPKKAAIQTKHSVGGVTSGAILKAMCEDGIIRNKEKGAGYEINNRTLN